MASPPRVARVAAPVIAAPLRNNRLEDPDWLSSGEWMTSISFGVFIAFASPLSIPGESSVANVWCGKGPWDSPGWIDYGPASLLDFAGGDKFQSEDL